MTERKKKKPKSDAKASEQMRNWLNKPKTTTKCTQPVSFQTFSKLVENLPDIAFQIQVTEISAYKKTLDECAEWFYNAFYSDPAIRTKYEIQLRSCPLAIKEKLLQLPSVDSADGINRDTESSPGSDNDRPQNTEGVEVSVTKCGRFLFPVTFATFEQYIIKDMLLPDLVRKQTKDKAKRKAILADKSKCRYILQKYYNSFYIFPSKRKLHKYGLKEAPPSLQSQLLKEGIPLDEMAKKTVEGFFNQNSGTAKLPEACKPQDSISSIVNFAVFQKYVTNMHNIAWCLKLNEPEYACKGFEDCAFAYYLAFYLRPEIRDRYPYQLAPCTTAMRNRLLASPNHQDVEALLEMERLNIHLPLSQELEIRSKPVEDQCKIANVPEVETEALESESQEVEICSKPVEDQCEIEKDLEKSLECEMQQLLSQEFELASKPVEDQCKITNVPEMESKVLENKQTLANEESKETQPVTFALFKRFIRNLDRIVEEMLSCEEYRDKSKDECALEYFKAFYATPQIREKFAYEIRPCPAKMRQRLLSIPEDIFISTERSSVAIELTDKPTAPAQLRHNLMEMASAKEQQPPKEVSSSVTKTSTEPCTNSGPHEQPENEKQPSTENHQPKTTVDINRNPKGNSGNKVVVLDERIIIPIENINYVFPVSVQTFQRFINYDTLKVELAKRFAKSNNVEKLLSNERSNSILLLRFYRSFYIDKSIRKKFNYNFDAAPVEMQQRLLQYAVPQREFAMSTAPQDAIKIDSKTTQECNQKDASVAPVQPIVTVVPFNPAPPVAPEQPVATAPAVVPMIPIAPVPTVVPLAPVAPVQPVVPVAPVAVSPAVSIPDQKRVPHNDSQYPVTFRAFSNLLNLDDIVKQMQQEAHYAKMSAKECQLAYYKAFYRYPKIREKYTYIMKPCPSILKAKILEIPVISDHNYSSCSPERDSESILADMYASRAAELSKMEKENVVEYVPHNLGSYIALRLQCPQKRSLLEKHFMERKRPKITATSKVAISEENTVTSEVAATKPERELNRVSKTPEVTATVDKTCPMEVEETATTTASEVVENPDSISEVTESVVTATVDRTSPMEVVETTASEMVEKSASISETTISEIAMGTVVAEATKDATPTASASLNVVKESKDKPTTSSALPEATKAVTPNASKTPGSVESTTVNVVSTSKVISSISSASSEATASTTVNVVPPSKDMPSTSSASSETTASTTVNVVPPSKDMPSTSSASNSERSATESASEAVLAAKSSKSVTESQTLTISLVSSRPSHTLSKLTKDFFTPNGKEHNMKYLIYTSHGLNKTIWRILSQLSFSEFRAYTSIYEGESLYTDESLLGRVYYHVIAKGNWPISLHVKFSMLSELFKSKGVYIDVLDLGQLSPKIFCWRELSRFTNFEDIAECDYGDRTGRNVEDVPHMFTLVEQFYVRCWTHDQWIQQAPNITVENWAQSQNREDTKAANITMLPAAIPVCLIEYNANAPEVTIEILSEGTATTESDTTCPPTQLEVSLDQHSFVDVENVCPASQVAQTQNDPLMQTSLPVPVPIKQEPVEFLTRMRFSINSEKNSEFICEPITTEELIINLDTEEDDRKGEELTSQPIITENVDNDEDEQMAEDLASQPIAKEDTDGDKRIELNVTSTILIDDSQDILDEVMYEQKMASFNDLESSETPELMEVEAASTDGIQGEVDQSPAEAQTSPVAPLEPDQPEKLTSQPISTVDDNVDEQTEPNVTSVIKLLSACDIEYYQDILDEAVNKEQMAVGNESSEVSHQIQIQPASTKTTQAEVVQNSAETQNNSVLRSRLLSAPVEPVSVEPASVEVKQEPIQFLTMMRFCMNSEQSDEFRCEPITTEEQIINLDTEEDDLACFNMTPPNVTPAIALLTNSQREEVNDLFNGARDETLQEIPVQAAAPQVEVERNPVVVQPVAAPARFVTARKHQRGTGSTVPSKKPRLMADNVPQLRHDFRPLPLTAMVRIEGNLQGREDGAEQELPTIFSQGQEGGQMTASQNLALAADNTQLMESSQLQRLLDAPYVNLRQVNVVEVQVASDSDKNDRAATTQRSPQTVHIVFSTLQRYMYFNSLTTANITKYQINSLSLGSSYHQALICANGKLCNVYGPLLENLFPHCTASLLNDLRCLLQDIGEFSYNSRFNVHRESREDLRTRVLYAFMRAAPPFAHIRLQFENETREWASCSTILERDGDFVNRKPSCDVISGLRPEILERMKEVKKSLCNPL